MIQCPKCQSVMSDDVTKCEACGVLFALPSVEDVNPKLSNEVYLQEIRFIEREGIAVLKLMKIIGGLCLRHVKDAEFYLSCGQLNECEQSLFKAKNILKYKRIAWMYVSLIILLLLLLIVFILSLIISFQGELMI